MRKIFLASTLAIIPNLTFGAGQANQILDKFEGQYKTQIIQDLEKNKHLYSDVFKESFYLDIETKKNLFIPDAKFKFNADIAAHIPQKKMELNFDGSLEMDEGSNFPVKGKMEAKAKVKLIKEEVFVMLEKLSENILEQLPQDQKNKLKTALKTFKNKWIRFDISEFTAKAGVDLWAEIGSPKASYEAVVKRTKEFLDNTTFFTPLYQTVKTQGSYYVIDVKTGGDEFADILKNGEIFMTGLLTDLDSSNDRSMQIFAGEIEKASKSLQREVRNSNIEFNGSLKIHKWDMKNWELKGMLGENKNGNFKEKISIFIKKDKTEYSLEIRPTNDLDNEGFLKINHQLGKSFNIDFRADKNEGFNFNGSKAGASWKGMATVTESKNWGFDEEGEFVDFEEPVIKTYKVFDFQVKPTMKKGSGNFNFYKEDEEKVATLNLSKWNFKKDGTAFQIAGKFSAQDFFSGNKEIKEMLKFDVGVKYTPLRNLNILTPRGAIKAQDIEGLLSSKIAPQKIKKIKSFRKIKVKKQNKVTEIKNTFSRDKTDPALGRGKLTVVEFTSFACPYCKRAHEQNKNYFAQLAREGKISYIIKDFPLDFEGDAVQKAHISANLVLRDLGEKAYFEFIDSVFETQDDWKKLSALDAEVFFTNLGESMFDYVIGDWENEDIIAEIENDKAEGKENFVTGTPNFFIGNSVVKGAYPLDIMKEKIEALLKK